MASSSARAERLRRTAMLVLVVMLIGTFCRLSERIWAVTTTSCYFAATYRHTLVRVGDDFKIKLQRVDLMNGQAIFDYVLQVWV